MRKGYIMDVRSFAAGLLAAFALSACAVSAPPPAAYDEVPVSGAVEAYRIGVDDLVTVNVWRNEDLSVTVPVRPDGRISVPLVGDVEAAGKTPDEVGADIEKSLATYVRDPKVAVILSELRSHEYLSRVRVTGAVKNPISIPYRQGMTVIDAVLAAGGVTEFASADRTVLYRRDASATESMPVRLGALLNRGDLSTNYAVRPGDVITVPERTF